MYRVSVVLGFGNTVYCTIAVPRCNFDGMILTADSTITVELFISREVIISRIVV